MSLLHSALALAAVVCIAAVAAAVSPAGRRAFVAALAVLLCAAAVAGLAAVTLLPMVSGWMDVAIVASVLVAVLLPVYLLVHPPDFGEDGDDSGGGGKRTPPVRPEPPAPPHGPPDLDWSSFDDARRDWEREPVSR